MKSKSSLIKFQLILIVSCLTLYSYSQLEWAPDNAVWHCNYQGYMFIEGYCKVTITGDTLLNGISCRKMNRHYYAFNYNSQDSIDNELPMRITYADQDRVYLWSNGVFNVLYDFSYIAGDTFTLDAEGICPEAIFTVSEVGTININGYVLRYYDVVPSGPTQWYQFGRIIEYIGAIDASLFEQPDCLTTYDNLAPLRCYQDDFLSYVADVSPECDYLPSLIDDTSNFKAIFPNPAIDQLNISGLPLSINFKTTITDTSGRLLMTEYNQQQMDVAHLPSGIYFIEVGTEESRVVLRFVKH